MIVRMTSTLRGMAPNSVGAAVRTARANGKGIRKIAGELRSALG